MPNVADRYFEDFKTGDIIALEPYPVTHRDVLEFAAEFDPQPLHLDHRAAGDNMLGELAASGWHTCAMVMAMIMATATGITMFSHGHHAMATGMLMAIALALTIAPAMAMTLAIHGHNTGW